MAINPYLPKLEPWHDGQCWITYRVVGPVVCRWSSPVVCVVFRGSGGQLGGRAKQRQHVNGGQAANIGCWMDHPPQRKKPAGSSHACFSHNMATRTAAQPAHSSSRALRAPQP
jgi:hypothetical protein